MVLVDRLDKTLTAVNDNVCQVANTAARLSSDVGEILTRLEGIKDSAAGLVDMGDAQHLAANLLGSLPSVPGMQQETPAQKEIAFLLQHIRESGATFEYEGKSRSAQWLALKLQAKTMIAGSTVDSAEAFIEKVAASTGAGSTYEIVHEDGSKEPLSDWLRAALAKYRTDATSTSPPDATETPDANAAPTPAAP